MMGAGIHFPPFALPVDELTAPDDGVRAVSSVPYPRMDESEALPGCNVEGLGVARGSVGHSVMLSLGAGVTSGRPMQFFSGCPCT
jgi:hypothetical protein